MRYRAVCKSKGILNWVEIQSKKKWYKPWEHFARCCSVQEADILVKRLSEGTVVTGIHNYDASGERIFECYW